MSTSAPWSNSDWFCSLLTMVLNGAAQLLIIATTRKGSKQD